MNPLFMREAIGLARNNVRGGCGGPFGAILVRDGEIIARGTNQVTTWNDPTAHAEIVAIREACRNLNTFRLDACEIYCTCEPCPMCLGAIYWARIHAVYYANTRADAAGIGFADDWIYRELAFAPAERQLIMRQMLRDEALGVFSEWSAKADKLPY
jgi:tRNA(Arg) A34 adenosine deaminase TadA